MKLNRILLSFGLAASLSMLAAGGAFAQKKNKDEGGGMPNALQGFSRNKNEPVKIEANKLEVRDKEKLAIFTGNVFVQQGDTTMRSPELRVYYEADTAKSKGKKTSEPATADATPVAATKTDGGKVAATEKDVSQKIKKIEALGGVIVTSKEQKATGHRADFMMKENVVVLSGNVVVSQGQNVMRGERLVVELNSSRAHMEGGRVQGLFLPSDKDDKKGKAESGKKK
ncbi:MAG TPA: LptA/OstA family protein [Xanthobacteraceae bacterium]|jgi:lipopolysaccharide export system protein LptA|nr:LptA/OstA family protein [Xanthobacteraceae bacterium]